VQGCRYVIHCGAALRKPLPVQRAANVDGTRNLALAAAQAGVGRLVHVSTLAVYGLRPGHCTEDQDLRPDPSAYSLTKTEAEGALRAAAAETGLSYAIVRPGTIYGPRGHWTRTYFNLARRKPAIFVGPGTGVLPLIYMDDLLEELWLCAQTPAADGEVFNAAYTPQPTVRQVLMAFAALTRHQSYVGLPIAPLRGLARLLAALAPATSNLKVMPANLEILVRPQTYSMEKAQRLLGWQPQIDVTAGAQKSAPWLREIGLLAEA
jgi:nucleoside-diphosphate-sugar epimerase